METISIHSFIPPRGTAFRINAPDPIGHPIYVQTKDGVPFAKVLTTDQGKRIMAEGFNDNIELFLTLEGSPGEGSFIGYQPISIIGNFPV